MRKRRTAKPAQQDWNARHRAEQLQRWAQSLLGGVPYSAAVLPKHRGLPLPALCLDDRERWAIAGYLHELAQLPRVIDSVIKARVRPAKKRGRHAKAERNWRIRLDHKATQERLGDGQAKRVVGEVADAHGVKRTAVYETQACEKAAGWMDWEKYMRQRVRAENPDASGDELLLKISQKMRSPGNSA